MDNIENKICGIEQRLNNHDNRMVKLEIEVADIKEDTAILQKLATSVEKQTLELSYVKDNVSDIKKGQEAIGEKISELELSPAKKWNSTVTAIVSVIVTAVVMYFLTKLGIG